MTIKKSIFLLFIFIFSCVEIGDNKPPKNLIPPEQMSFIMIDVILMKNIILKVVLTKVYLQNLPNRLEKVLSILLVHLG